MYSSRTLVAVVFLFCMTVALASLTPPGGLFRANTHSKDVVRAALFATQIFNFYYSRELAGFKAERVVSAEKQVVAGTNYILEVLLELTRCRRDAPYWVLQSCPLQEPKQPLLCKFVVVDVPWQNGLSLKSVKCRWFWGW